MREPEADGHAIRSHVVAVPPDRDDEPVQSFRTFTTDLHRLADWRVARQLRQPAW